MKERFKSYIFILVIAIIVSIPLFRNDFNIYIDDGIQHICRLMGTYQSITEGQTFPVIMSNFCNQFGYSWNLFYSPITAFVPLLFRLFTSSFIICLKLFILLVAILSGIFMYEFLVKVTNNKYVGLLGAAIYVFAPYRLNDMYMRIAIAELTSFIFLPIVFEGLYLLFNVQNNNKKRAGAILTIGAIGLILSHIVIAMYTAIFSLVYVVINIKKLKNKAILKQLFLSLIFIILITSFFLGPILEHKFTTQYEVFKDGRMAKTDVIVAHKVDAIDLIYTQKGNPTFEIGLVTIVGVLLTLLAYKKVNHQFKTLYIFSLVSGIISIIMTLKWFPFEKLPAILKMLQFSFRMLEFSTFFLCIVTSINFSIVIKNFKMKDVFMLTLILILLVLPLTNKFQHNVNIDESRLWPAVPVTENTKKVHAGCASFEYLPSKAFDNLAYIKTRENRAYVLNGNAEITDEQKDGTNLKFKVSDIKEDTVIELPYIYYLGYNITIQEKDGKEFKLNTYESINGFVEIHLDNIKEATVKVRYTGSNIMKASLVISILSFSIMILYYCIDKRKLL